MENVGIMKTWISKLLKRYTLFRGNIFSKTKSNCYSDLGFVDLTPSDNADSDGFYSKTLSWALNKGDVLNIALTGPYGSGKSSIIKTFQRNASRKLNFLNISLASFEEIEPEYQTGNGEATKGQPHRSLIERSILQQMLYGADADNLPYSRFKRIRTPKHSTFKSTILALWIINSYIAYTAINFHFDKINSSDYLDLWWIGIIMALIFITVPIAAFRAIYKSTYGVSFRKISLSKIEIEAENIPDQSILNRHLDEIIYFFQETDYDAVVFEDLDRFKDPEIFVKLREINNLINKNYKTKKRIRFLYALKDDMFSKKNRAKFFDFIIPVVPIVNSSNSFDLMQKRLTTLNLRSKIEEQFLKDVSLYIDDLRLINNTLNELLIYLGRLKSKKINNTKLLAMMIYKNFYPKDFEDLHHGKGVVFDVCGRKSEYLKKSAVGIQTEIEKYKNHIELSDKEIFKNLDDLMKTYVAHIIAYAVNPIQGVYFNQKIVRIADLISLDSFEELSRQSNIGLAVRAIPGQWTKESLGKSFANIEEEINPGATFKERKINIENKGAEEKATLQNKIIELEKEKTNLQKKELFQLIKKHHLELDEILTNSNISNTRLLGYLLNRGYVDDTYHLYISSFHEGRVTHRDREFLMSIHSSHQLGHDQKLDNPSEICISMRDADFETNHALNINLVDYLLDNKAKNIVKLESVFTYISENTSKCDAFFASYLESGENIKIFIDQLSRKCASLIEKICNISSANNLVYKLFEHIETEQLTETLNSDHSLTIFLEKDPALIMRLTSIPNFEYQSLKKLGIRITDLNVLDYAEPGNILLDYIHTESLYEINFGNIFLILKKYSMINEDTSSDLELKNLTVIFSHGSENLTSYIRENFEKYNQNILEKLPKNNNEDYSTILELINSENLHYRTKEKIISKQNFEAEDIKDFPKPFWDQILRESKISPTWENINSYSNEAGFNNELLITYLSTPEIFHILSKSKIDSDEIDTEDSNSLAQYILEENNIEDNAYSELLDCIDLELLAFPEKLSDDKLKSLIDKGIVVLSKESFSLIKGKPSLAASLIARHFEQFELNKDDYPIQNEIRHLLILGDLSNEEKLEICSDLMGYDTEISEEFLADIADVLAIDDLDLNRVLESVALQAMSYSRNESVSLRILMKGLKIWGRETNQQATRLLRNTTSKGKQSDTILTVNKTILSSELAKELQNFDFIKKVEIKKNSIEIHFNEDTNLE